MVRAKTLAVVAGLTVCSVSLAMAGPGRFVHQSLIILGFDDSQTAPNAQELLRKGIDEYRQGHYDDATKSFNQVSTMSGLSDREQEVVAQYRALLVRVNKSRQEASELLTAAQRAYEQGDFKQAESLATTVAANGNASPEDRDEAKAILVKLQSPHAPAPNAPPGDTSPRHEAHQLLAQARQSLRQGNLDDAESLARQAESHKITYGRLEDSPAKLLQDIADARASKVKATAGTGSPKTRAKLLVAEANACLKRNEIDRAEQLAKQAKELNARFYLYENSPDDVLLAVQRAKRQRANVALKNSKGKQPVEAAQEPPTKVERTANLAQVNHEDSISISSPDGGNAEPATDLAATSQDAGPSDPAGETHGAGKTEADVRQMLAQARKLIETGHLDEAEQVVAQAESQNITWGPYNNPIQVVRRELAVARAQGTPSSSSGAPAQAHTSTASAGSDKRKDALRLLRDGRGHLRAGNLEKAEECARQAAELNASYRLLDDTPRQLSADIARATEQRSTNALEETVAATETPDSSELSAVAAERPTGTSREVAKLAQGHLKAARACMDRGDFDSAIEIAQRIHGWNLSYGFWDDTPAKVENAAKALKSRAVARAGSGTTSQRLVPLPVETAPARDVVQAEHSAKTPAGSEPPAEAIEWLAGAKSSALAVPANRPATRPLPATIIQTAAESDPAAGSEIVQAEHAPVVVAGDQQQLEMARELFERGNYPRARERALEVAATNQELKPQAEELISRVNIAEQTAAYQLYEAGVASAQKRDYRRALTLFQQVYASGVQFDPATDQQLRAYLRDLPNRIGTSQRNDVPTVTVADGSVQVPSAGEPQDITTGDIGQRERAKFQQLVTETNQKVQAAKLLLATNPSQAIRDLELAQESVRSSGLDSTMTEPLVRRLETAIRYAGQEKHRVEAERLQQASSDAASAQRKRQLAAEEVTRREVFELVEKGQALYKEAHYEDAELAARQALERDPDNLAAIALNYKARIERQLQIQKDLQELKDSRILDTLHAVDESALPFGNDNEMSVRYMDAKKWEDLSESRKRRFEGIEKSIRTPKELEIERKLGQPITISFTETPLAEVVAFLQEYTDVNVVLDKNALAVDGISSDRPVTMKLDSIPLRSALRLILGQMDLDYLIQNDVLLITTPLRKQGDMTAKSYFVGDLVVPISAFPGSNVGGQNVGQPNGTIGFGPGTPGNNQPPGGMPMPNAALAQIGSGIGGSPPLTMGGNVLPGYSNNTGLVGTPPGGMGTGQIVDFDSLIELIEQTIAPNSWSTVGGAGTIQEFQPNLSLVVNQTQAVHEQISDLLTQLRRLQDLQVTVEVKFVTLTEDFFERIGVDFDMDIQSDAQAPLRSFGSVITPATFGTGGGGGGTTFTPPVLNLFYNDHDDDVTVGVNQFRGSNGLGSSGSPVFTPDLKIPFRTGGFEKGRPQGFVPGDGLSFGIAFLSDIEVFLFLEAAQQSNRGNVLTAPKVTLFNGQFAFVFSGSIEPFVTALNPVVAAGAVAFDPQIQQFFNGAFLGVQAVISADRRYVRLSLFPSFTSISGEKRFTVTGGAGGFGGGGGGGGGGAANAQAEIVVPIISANFVATTVSVPDGGTVMMGGLKSKSEFRNEFGTPILNKIPYVQRLFMNTGISSVTRSLLLMVTPRIIIQEEEEELLGKTIAM